MNLFAIVAPFGGLTFLLFCTACVCAVPRFRLFRYHKYAALACICSAVTHAGLAIHLKMIAPMGLAAVAAMIGGGLTGFFRAGRKIHMGFAAATFILIVLHVTLVVSHG